LAPTTATAEAKFIETYNTDLANAIGNCTSRVAKMTASYFGGVLPAPGGASAEHALDAERAVTEYHACMALVDLGGAAAAAMSLVRAIDGYIERTAPFKLAKDPARLPEVGAILYNCAETLRIVSVLLWPFVPAKTGELWRRLGCGQYAAALADKGRGSLAEWTRWGQLEPGTPITAGEPLFPRYQRQGPVNGVSATVGPRYNGGGAEDTSGDGRHGVVHGV
jgi:methionyl-tRNA synthetase